MGSPTGATLIILIDLPLRSLHFERSLLALNMHLTNHNHSTAKTATTSRGNAVIFSATAAASLVVAVQMMELAQRRQNHRSHPPEFYGGGNADDTIDSEPLFEPVTLLKCGS